MIKSLRFYLQILLLLCVFGIKAISQNYPLSGTVSFIPQQSLTWSSFYTTNALTITINLKDNTSSPGPVFARIALTRQGIDIRNNESFVASKGITVNFGGITTITGIDLAENFLPSNLVSQGLDPNFFSQGGVLSSGFWTIEVILYELNAARNYRQVSDKFSYSFTQYNGLPPLLNLPSNESEVDARYGQNFSFLWTPQATSLNGQSGVSYQFSLWELGEDENANDASEGKTPIYTTSVSVPMLAYDATKPLLQTGKRYAWQVQVKDVSGTNVYDNQGKSQVWEFRYGLTCSAPNALLLKSVGSGYHELSWGAVNLAQSYQVRWRKKSSKDDYTFQNTTTNNLVLALPSGNEYELSVQSVCSGENSQWSSDIYQENPQSGTGSTTATVIPNAATNPADIPVNGSDVNQQDYDNLVSNLQRPPTTTETRCGVSVVKDVVSCQDDQVSNTGVGSVPFTSKPNSTFYVNGYDVRITKVIDNTSGEGLLYFPILGQRIPVIWKGVQLMEGIGLHETQPYGCLTSGEVQMVGSDPTMLNRDLTAQYNNLYNSLNSPGSYSGTFGQALEAMKAKAQELLDKISKLKPGEKLSKEDYAGYNSVCKAVKKGIEAFSKQLVEQFGEKPSLPEIKKLMTQLTTFKEDILKEVDCDGVGYLPIRGKNRHSYKGIALYASLSSQFLERSPSKIVSELMVVSKCKLEGAQQLASQISAAVSSFMVPENKYIVSTTIDDLTSFTEKEIPFITPSGEIVLMSKNDFENISFNPDGALIAFTKKHLSGQGGTRYVGTASTPSSMYYFEGYKQSLVSSETPFRFSLGSLPSYAYVGKIDESDGCKVKLEKVSLTAYTLYSNQAKIRADINSLITATQSSSFVESKARCKISKLEELIQSQNGVSSCMALLKHLQDYFAPSELSDLNYELKTQLLEAFTTKKCVLEDNWWNTNNQGENYFVAALDKMDASEQAKFLDFLRSKNIMPFLLSELDTRWAVVGGQDNFTKALSILSRYARNVYPALYSTDIPILTFPTSSSFYNQEAFYIDITQNQLKYDVGTKSLVWLMLFRNNPRYFDYFKPISVNFGETGQSVGNVLLKGPKVMPALMFVLLANDKLNEDNLRALTVFADEIAIIQSFGAATALMSLEESYLKSYKFWLEVTVGVGSVGNIAGNMFLAEKLAGTDFLKYWNTIQLLVGVTQLGITIDEFVKARQLAKQTLLDSQQPQNVLDDFEHLADELQAKVGVLEEGKITTTAELKTFLNTIDETTTIVHLEQRGIKCFFRGTTRSKADNELFPGNTNSQVFGISTSTDPIKATIFSIESATSNGAYKGVLQIGLPNDLKSIALSAPNYRVAKELEVVLNTPASNFANLSKVEISVENARKVIKEVYGIDLPSNLTRSYADELLETIPESSLDKAFEFYQKAIQYNTK